VKSLLVCLFLGCGFASSTQAAQTLEEFKQKPKLVVVLVIDQFRADYLTRFEKSFLPAQGGKLGLGGFEYLMSKGAYFPFAHYNIFQAMTCSGHAMILTGAYPSENGISMNEWFDRESGKMVYCANDELNGVSPLRLKSTTLSDEFKNIDKKSKVVSIALKDRSAVMMGGHRGDLVLWMDNKELNWGTSKYYGQVPSWLKGVNSSLNDLKNKSYSWKKLARTIPYAEKKVFASPFGIELTAELAIQALEQEKLGQSKDQIDFLFVSFSSHDYAGHLYGPNSPELEDMTLTEDRQISRLLNTIEKKVGLKNAYLVLTADHGIPAATGYLKERKTNAGRIDYLALFKRIYAQLDAKFGQPKSGPWIQAYKYFNFYLNPKVLEEKKLEASVVSQEIKKLFLKEEGVSAVYTRDEILQGKIYPGLWAEALVNQFVYGNNGDLIFMPEPFYYEKSEDLTTHLTGYNYDTRVPLILVGAPFKAGVYNQYARIIDLVPTLSHVLNIVAPPKARGRVLTEAFK
jgi:predicted AlkP superfamily pyrophosphatase or phosphodiesterase